MKKLVGQIVDYYFEVKDTKEAMEAIGRVGSDEITMMEDLLIDLDKILTNVSKRWAKGNKTRGRIKVKYVRPDQEDTSVQVTVNTL